MKFVETLKNRSASVADLITDIQNTGILLTELKTFSVLYIWLLQAEMQKLMFELSLISFFGALKESNVSILQDNFTALRQFNLEKFISVG